MSYSIGVSGHRHLDAPEAVRKRILDFLNHKKQVHPQLQVLTSLAEGADTLFAEVALNQNLPLTLILPFQEADYIKTFESEESIQKFNHLKARAEAVITLQEIDSENDWERKMAYLDCGTTLADRADEMLLIYDGLPSKGKGGTGDIASYCVAHGIPHTIIPASKPDNSNTAELKRLEELRIYYKTEAARLQKKHRKIWRWLLIAGLIASFSFAYTTSFPDSPLLYPVNLIEFLSFILALVLFGWLELKNFKKRRINARRNSEVLRTALHFIKGKIPLQRLKNFELFKEYIAPEVVEALEPFCTHPSKGTPAEKKASLLVLVDEQLNYHKKECEKNGSQVRLFERIETLLLGIFILITLIYNIPMLDRIFGTDFNTIIAPFAPYLSFFIFSIPPVLAAIEAYAYFEELRRDLKVSTYLLKHFEAIQIQLEEPIHPTWELDELAHQVREKMDDENIFWCINIDVFANSKIG